MNRPVGLLTQPAGLCPLPSRPKSPNSSRAASAIAFACSLSEDTTSAAAATAGVIGGGTYDALVGLTAHSFGHELLSLDLRAERTYQSLGIAYRLLAP